MTDITRATTTTTTPTATGKTVIDDAVVSKVAGIAVREVPGVHGLGGGAARAIGALRDAIGQHDHSQGVKVEVGEHQVAADVVIVAEYPVALQELAEAVRSSVTRAIEQLVGLDVTEVNVTVQDVFVPGVDDDDKDEQPARVA